jgi:nitrite reductase/ring-hydroxylating ferredoxin subunit
MALGEHRGFGVGRRDRGPPADRGQARSLGTRDSAGAVDWSEQHEQQMRVGVVHALANAIAAGCYSGSLLTRRPRASRALRLAGLAALAAGGIFGGHLSFRLAGGANHAEAVPHLVEPGWHHLTAVADLPEGKAVRVMLGEVPVVVIRAGGQVPALADRCSHMSRPLSDGDLAEGRLTCPGTEASSACPTGRWPAGPPPGRSRHSTPRWWTGRSRCGCQAQARTRGEGRELGAALLFTVTSVIWDSSFLFIRIAVEHMPPPDPVVNVRAAARLDRTAAGQLRRFVPLPPPASPR